MAEIALYVRNDRTENYKYWERRRPAIEHRSVLEFDFRALGSIAQAIAQRQEQGTQRRH